jgi:hypothetical protein
LSTEVISSGLIAMILRTSIYLLLVNRKPGSSQPQTVISDFSIDLNLPFKLPSMT